jgi:hypothetical protein
MLVVHQGQAVQVVQAVAVPEALAAVAPVVVAVIPQAVHAQVQALVPVLERRREKVGCLAQGLK